MSLIAFSEAFCLGTLLEEKESFSLLTHDLSLQLAATNLHIDAHDKYSRELVSVASCNEIPTRFDQLDAFQLPSCLCWEYQKITLLPSIKNEIIKKAQEEQICPDEYFDQLCCFIYNNRNRLIKALEHDDQQTITKFRENRKKYPWHLLHLLPEQEWQHFKEIVQNPFNK